MKAADRKCYILCDSIYMTLWKRQNYWDRNRSIYQGLQLGGGDRLQGVQGNLEGWWKYSILTVVVIIQMDTFVKTQHTIYLKGWIFTGYKLMNLILKIKEASHILPSFWWSSKFYIPIATRMCLHVCMYLYLSICIYMYICIYSYICK